MNFFFENPSLLPETSAAMEHFKLLFGSGNSDPVKIRPLKVGPPAINWKSSLNENSHPMPLLTVNPAKHSRIARNGRITMRNELISFRSDRVSSS